MNAIIRRRRAVRLRKVPISAAGLLWRAVAGTLRDFVWADLRDGTLSLSGLSLGTRSLIWLGFGLLVAALGMVVANDTLRAQLPLVALPNAVTGRGSLVPIALVPATLFLIALAWAFILTGALHAHPLIRVGTALLYMALAINWISEATISRTVDLFLSWGAILLVPVIFALRWRAAPRPVLEFTPLLLLTSVTYVVLQTQGAQSWRITGVALVLSQINNETLSLTLLILPLLALVGMSVAGFTRQAAGWTVDLAGHWLSGRVLRLVLVLVLAWRLREVVLEALSRADTSTPRDAMLAYAGALGVPLLVGLAWLLVTKARARRPDRPGHDEPGRNELRPYSIAGANGGAQFIAPAPDPVEAEGVAKAADRHALSLIVAYVAPQLLAFLLVTFLLPATVIGLLSYGVGQRYLAAGVDALNSDNFSLPWRLLVTVAAVVAGVVLARRLNPDLGLYLAVFGLTAALRELTNPARLLGALAPYGGLAGLVDFWWVLICGMLGAAWLVRGRLTDDRVARLLLVLLMTALLRQTDFISNRFSPFFGSGGVLFIAFGLAWDALTIGAWANQSTHALPRVSRVFLYLGYSLLTITVVNWAVSVHDLTAISRLTGEAALDGLQVYGRPMLYAVFAVTLASAGRAPAPEQVPEADTATPDP